MRIFFGDWRPRYTGTYDDTTLTGWEHFWFQDQQWQTYIHTQSRKEIFNVCIFSSCDTFLRWNIYATKKMIWVLVQEFLTMIALVLAVFLTRSKQRTSRASFGHSAKPVLHYERSKHNCAGINCLFMLGMGLQTNFLDVLALLHAPLTVCTCTCSLLMGQTTDLSSNLLEFSSNFFG